MNGENELNSPILEETTYDPNKNKKNNSLEGMTAPVLDDMDYVAPTAKKDGPTGVSAPILDDMNSYTAPTAKKEGPKDVTAPVLDSPDSYYSQPKQQAQAVAPNSMLMQFTPEQQEAFNKLSPEQQAQVIEMRKQQIAQLQQTEAPVTAPVLDDDNYVPPVKNEADVPKPSEPISAPILDDEPAPARYVPNYADEDLERVKQEASKKAVADQLTSKQKDEKESLRMMQELRREREEEAAHKGFFITIAIAVIGVIASVLFAMFASGDVFGLNYDAGIAGNKFTNFVSSWSFYISVASGLFALLLITGIGGIKSFTSFIYFVYSIIIIISGIVLLPQKDGHMLANSLLYAVSLVGMIAVFITLSTSECVNQYFKKR